MVRYQRLAKVAAVGAVAALALAACSSNSSSSSSSPSSSGGGGMTSGYNAALTGYANPSTQTGGTLKIVQNFDCDSWDPARTYYANCWVLQRVFERTLMGYSSAPGPVTVLPDLASAPGVPSDNATVWTYQLRPGIKYANGQVITSYDIKYAIERVFATGVINGGPTYVLCALSKCDASGAPAYPGPYKSKTGLSSIVTPNASTIIFHLTKPFSDWNYIMALPDTAPVPAKSDTGAKYGLNPVSSGPYEFTAYKPQQSITFVRNPYWQQSTDPIRHQYPQEITFKVVTDPTVIDQQLLAGQADIDATGVGVQTATQAKIVNSTQYKPYVDNPVTNFTSYISVMQTVPPLNNIHCREAIFYAINKENALLAAGGSLDGTITGQMLPPNVPGYNASLNPYPDGANYTGDVAAAKQQLQLCGKPNGFTTGYAYGTPNPKAANGFVYLQQDLKKIGVTLVAKTTNAQNYYSTWIGDPANIVKQGIGLAAAAWGADFPTGIGFFKNIAYGPSIQPNGGNTNYPSLNDPVVNKAIDQLSAATDTATRNMLTAEINTQVMKDAVYLPTAISKAVDYRNPETTNVYVNPAFGMYDICVMGVKSAG